MRTLRNTLIWVCSTFAVCSALSAEVPMPSLDDVWLYAPLDGSLQPAIDKNFYQAQYRQWSKQAVTEDLNPQPTFVDGLAGKAVFIHEATDEQRGDALAFLLNGETFPRATGSIALWYKPTRPLATDRTWLYGAGWCTFQADIGTGNLMVYATSDNAHWIRGSLNGFADRWENHWHLIVATWNGSQVTAYVDGQKIAERTDAKPLIDVPSVLFFGSLEPGGERKTPVGYAEAAYDDVVILTKPMTEAQVVQLYKSGSQPGFLGFLHTLGHGALVQMKRHAYLRGEKATVHVTPFSDAANAKLVATWEGKPIRLADVPTSKESDTVVDTAPLRPGKYGLHVEFYRDGTKVASSAETSIVIRGQRQPEFPVGIGGSFSPNDETLALYEKLHISHISGNGPQGDIYFWKQLDRAFARGICLFPNFNILEVWGGGEWSGLKKPPYFIPKEDGGIKVNPEWGWKFLQTLAFADGSADDHLMTSSASPFSPIAFDMMAARTKQIMTVAGDHPGLWAVSFQDEVPFRMGKDKATGKLKIGDYSFYAIQHFKKVTGLKAPAFPPNDPAGTVWPENHPYLLWMRHVGLPGNDFTTVGMDDLYFRLGKEVKKYRPDVITCNYSGGEYGQNDNVLDWNYPVIWETSPWGSGPGSGYLDYVFDRHWARQSARPRKPLWALLGWWSGDMSKQPDWCVADFRLNTEWALAKGCKQLMWFSIGHGPFFDANSGPFSKPELRTELGKWSNFLHDKGPLFARLEKRPDKKTAVLWSETNRAGHVLNSEDKAEYYLVLSGLRNIGAQPDLITDQMIREGVLDDYEALVLCGFDYSSEELWNRIKAFAATKGKKVFCDTSSKLVPPGVISLGASWSETFEDKNDKRHPVLKRSESVAKWSSHLRPIVLPQLSLPDLEITDSDGHIGAHLLWAGQTPYLFIINTDMEKERTATVLFKHESEIAYDLMSGQKLPLTSKDGRLYFQPKLSPGAWAAYVLPPVELTTTTVTAKAASGRIEVKVSLLGKDSKPLAAAWPLRIEFLDPQGKPTLYEIRTSTDATGSASPSVQIAPLTDEAGEWTIRVTEMLTGRQTIRKLEVRP